MTITWMGHACFVLESGGFRVLIDPYKGVPGLTDISMEADAVYCSHGHFDHAYTENVTLSGKTESPFVLKEISAFHDEEQGAKRGENMIRSFTAEGITVVHLGDLGHSLSREQVDAIGKCDVLLLPVGGTYTVDPLGARAVVDAVGPRIAIPMHYRRGEMGFEVLHTVEDFTALYPAELVKEYDGNCLAVDADTPDHIALLRV